MDTYIKEIIIENMPNLHNSWRALTDVIVRLIDERNARSVRAMNRDVNVRVVKTQEHLTQAYVSMYDLADNEWLWNQLEGHNFNGLTRFRLSVNRNCAISNDRLLNEVWEKENDLKEANEKILKLEEEMEQMKAKTSEEAKEKDSKLNEAEKKIVKLDEEIGQLKSKTSNEAKEKADETETKYHELKRKIKELLD